MKKFVTYRRVSSEMQGDSGLGLEGQSPIIAHFTKEGEVIGDFVEVQSAKDLKRPELQKAIELTKKEGAILVVAKADRLSRNVQDALAVIDDIGEKNLLCCDCPETNRFMITMVFAFAEHERLLISIRTKAALEAKKERQAAGVDRNAPSGRPKGYRHSEKTKEKIARGNQKKRTPPDKMTMAIAKQKREEGKSYSAIASDLNELGATAPNGGKFYGAQVRRFLIKEEQTK